jgi:hypothetical protein
VQACRLASKPAMWLESHPTRQLESLPASLTDGMTCSKTACHIAGHQESLQAFQLAIMTACKLSNMKD